MERLRVHASELLTEERPVVLAGDWNVIPTDDDVFSPKAMARDALMQPESRAAFRTIVHQGWTDAIRARHPDGPIWTFWDYTAGCWQRDAGFRIDHLLLSPHAADRLLDAGVDKDYRGREKASDHAPTWVEIDD
jgi:exodeoxyribonuclease III